MPANDDITGSAPRIRWVGERRRGALVLAASIALTFLPAVPSGSAQELDDRKERIERQIELTEKQLDQSSARLVATTQRLADAVTALDGARTTLAQTRAQLAAAQALDRKLQAELAEAVVDLTRARAALARGRASVSESEQALRTIAVQQYSSGGLELMALSTVFTSQNPAELTGQLNSQRSVLDKETATLARLEASQVMLAIQASTFRKAKRLVAERRAVALENLELRTQLESQAEQAQVRIKDLVVVRKERRQKAADTKAEDLRQLEEFQNEREQISALLKRRAEEAQARAAAARARAAKAKAAADRRAQAKAEEANGTGHHDSTGRSRSTSHDAPQQPPQPAPDGLIHPVDGYVTSSYGMRLHPVYKRWSLHDGTDFGASCGTPIRAATSGTVVGRYYDSAYGNRVIIDHGLVGGVGLGTSYNHMSAFSANVGQRVQRGDVIGFVGTTGYSTGCHLHFMVFENGAAVDPMNWL